MATDTGARDLKRRLLFVRVGWMRYYNGQVVGDDRPVGGGRYNREHVGHEAFNFHAVDGRVYGYFQPPMSSQKVNLKRIDLSAAAAGLLISAGLLVLGFCNDRRPLPLRFASVAVRESDRVLRSWRVGHYPNRTLL